MSTHVQALGGHPRRQTAPRRSGIRKLITRQRLFLGLACLFGGAVVVNALVMQTGKHPSPLFRTLAIASTDFPVPPARPAGNHDGVGAAFSHKPLTVGKPMSIERPKTAGAGQPVVVEATEALLLEIQRELGKRGYYKGDPDGKPGPKTTQAIRDFQFAQRVAVDGRPSEVLLQGVLASKVTMKDELLDLVRRTGQTEPAKGTITDIQRALNKSGYGPLEEDGHLGPTTRQALARFEADKKLPPRGEPKGPVLKLLASASGVPIKQP
jgi:peptidoglycan hydrolase-like protein with peptidoglycan-binding domain